MGTFLRLFERLSSFSSAKLPPMPNKRENMPTKLTAKEEKPEKTKITAMMLSQVSTRPSNKRKNVPKTQNLVFGRLRSIENCH